MPGKYSKFKNAMTKVQQEPEYQQRVNRMKDEIKAELLSVGQTISIANIGMVHVRARAEKARLEQLVKDQQLIIEATQQELVDIMESNDFTTVKIGVGVSVTIKDDIYCTVKDKPTFMRWIAENDMEDLLSVNYQTMAAMTKTRIQEGQPIPEGIDTYFKQSIMVRGASNVDEG
jgi:hypothetical protein